MRTIKMRTLALRLGIPVRTIQKWVQKDPSIATLRTGVHGGKAYWIKLDKLAETRGLPLHVAYNLTSRWFLKAVEVAEESGYSRKTVCNWCENRPGFGMRLGRVWYIDLESLGMSWEQAREMFRKHRGSGSSEPNADPEE